MRTVPSFIAAAGSLAVSLCVAGLFMVNAAHAQRDSRLDLATEADLHFERGVELQRRGDCDGALEHYLLSNRLAYNKNVVFNIAACFEELGRHSQAYRYYADYAAEELEDADREAAEQALARIRRRVALIRIESDPPGATIYLNRTELGARGRTPRTLAVEPGGYRVILRREGYEEAAIEVTASRGAERTVELSLTPILGTVQLVGGPAGAEVRVDDPESDPVGTVPGDVQIVPGTHTLIIDAPGHQTERVEVEVAPRQTLRRSVELALQTGTVLVDVQERGALIELDGNAVGFTPAVLDDVPAGPHTVRISRSGFRAFEESIEVTPNAQTEVEVRLRLQQEVTAASRQTESVYEAPASVTIIPQEELRAFGFQTVWDALGGLRGVYQTNDRSYASLGFRGFSQPQDYGNRLLVLTNGHVMNDDLLGSSYVGFDARSDLMDIERIEVVRGPGSALYGTNAFLGVINLVSRDRDTLMPPHASIATEGIRMARLRVGGGTRFDRDTGFWASASGLYSQGEDLYAPDLTTAPDGFVRDADSFYAGTAMARAWAGDFTLEGYWHRRRKQIPTGAFGTLVGDPRTQNTDSRGFVELRWEPRFSDEVSLSARTFLDYYEYEGDFAYDPEDTPPDMLETGVVRDRWLGYWAGGEARLMLRPLSWLSFTVGAEGRGSLVADLSSENDVDGRYLDETPRFFVLGGYAVADVKPIDEISIQLGGRYDFVSTFSDGAFSPRAAVVLRPWETGIFKLIGGSAFRAPSVYELRYNDGGVSQVAPDSLSPERIWTGELEFTQRIEEELSAIASVFYNYIDDAITTETIPGDVFRYTNSAEIVQTLGAEAELRREWRQGWMASVQYSYQRTRVGDLFSNREAFRVPNSPEHLVGFRGAAPLIPEHMILAMRLRFEGPRLGAIVRPDGEVDLGQGDAAFLADVILSGEFRSIGLSYAFGVRNLFDWQYGHPSGEDISVPFIPQAGRTFFLQTTVRFR